MRVGPANVDLEARGACKPCYAVSMESSTEHCLEAIANEMTDIACQERDLSPLSCCYLLADKLLSCPQTIEPTWSFDALHFFRPALGLGKSRGSFNRANFVTAFSAFLRLYRFASVSVGVLTLQPSSWKYWEIAEKSQYLLAGPYSERRCHTGRSEASTLLESFNVARKHPLRDTLFKVRTSLLQLQVVFQVARIGGPPIDIEA